MLRRNLGKWSMLVTGMLTAAVIATLAHEHLTAQEKADQNGDPLPAGALARMGTLRWRHGDTVSFVAYASEGKAVLTAANDGSIRLWDRDTGKEIRRFDQKQGAQPGLQPGAVVIGWSAYGRGAGRIAVSKDGKALATVLQNNIVQLWNVDTGKEIHQLKLQAGFVSSVHFAPDAKSIAVIANDRTIHLLDTETANEIRQIKPKIGNAGGRVFIAGGVNGADGFAFSHDGKTIAISEALFENQKFSRYVRLVETQTGKEIRTFEVPQQGVAAIAFSPDGKTLALGSGSAVHLRDADGAKEIRQINSGVVAGVIFSPDSKTIAVKCRDLVLRLYETDTGKAGVTIGEAPAGPGVNVAFNTFTLGEQRDVAFAPDGKMIAVGSGQTVRFYLAATGKEQAAVNRGHRNTVSSVLITPDGKTMVSRRRRRHPPLGRPQRQGTRPVPGTQGNHRRRLFARRQERGTRRQRRHHPHSQRRRRQGTAQRQRPHQRHRRPRLFARQQTFRLARQLRRYDSSLRRRQRR